MDETGLKRTVLETWPLADFTGVVSRHRVTEHAESTSHRYDSLLVDRSGAERYVSSSPSPEPARDLAAFLALPLKEVGPIDAAQILAPLANLPEALRDLWRERGLPVFAGKEEAISFLRGYAREHPDDPTALEILGTALAARGEVADASVSLLDAARLYRSRGETANAERAEAAARALVAPP